MNLEEARKVVWFKNYPRPMGELLDEGYLSQSRLEWAAEKAYIPQIKEAAKVILETMKAPLHDKEQVKPKGFAAPIEVSMSMEKARATQWPLPPFKGQAMGGLVDTKQLNLKDLGYAVENAWEEKVRQAAMVLLLARLEQKIKEPTPNAGFIYTESGGRSYAEKQETILTLLQGMVFGIMMSAGIALAIWSFTNGMRPNPSGKSFSEIISTPSGIIALVVVAGLFILTYWLIAFIPDQITKRLDKKIEEYRFGQEGEEQTVQSIVQILDGNWRLFQNINVPGPNKGDLDIILVGPPGIWVLEVKNLRGEYRNIGDNWEFKHGKQWKAAKVNPSRQAINNALRLKNFLKADNLNVFVNQAVVWANQENPPMVENPSVAVWQHNHLHDELGNIWQGEKLSKEEINKISDKLTKLCEQQRRRNNP